MTHNENLEPSSRKIYQKKTEPIKKALLVEEDCNHNEWPNQYGKTHE